jgi:hypothetical protein
MRTASIYAAKKKRRTPKNMKSVVDLIKIVSLQLCDSHAQVR